MKTETELNEMILGVKNLISTKYPELLKFLDEMPVTIPTKETPEINIKALSAYYKSLVDMVEDYKENNARNVKEDDEIVL